MNRFRLLIYLALIFTNYMYAQKIKKLELYFEPNEFRFERIDSVTHVYSDRYDVFFDLDTLNPALPYILFNILLDDSMDYNDYTFTYSEVDYLNDVIITNNQIEQPTSANSISNYFNITTDFASIYPKHIVELLGKYTLGVNTIVTLKVSPFKYYPKDKKLNIVDSLHITIFQKPFEASIKKAIIDYIKQ